MILPGKPRDLQVPWVTRCAKIKVGRMEKCKMNRTGITWDAQGLAGPLGNP